jgi:hypothetical protein
VLVSDHGVPLYDPLTTYQQLMAEDRSRVRACPRGSMSIERWNDGMAVGGSGRGAVVWWCMWGAFLRC